jgi:uncharacterized membrane protein
MAIDTRPGTIDILRFVASIQYFNGNQPQKTYVMPNHLTPLGIFHTVISILAIIAALIALFRDGKIDPRNGLGKSYLVLTIVTCLTSFGIMKTGHFTPAHGLSVLILMLLLIGVYARSIWKSGNRGEKAEIIVLSVTLFLSFIPAITETLTRLPISQPIAANQDAPVIKMAYLGLTVVFALGIFYQLRKLPKPGKV